MSAGQNNGQAVVFGPTIGAAVRRVKTRARLVPRADCLYSPGTLGHKTALDGKEGGVEQDQKRESGRKLQRGLKNRHIQMIALGGAIGTGLFYGSAASISLAGPSVLLAYLLGGAVIWLIMRMMGEMAVAEPVSGAFSHFAYTYWGEFPGFLSGWNYWFLYVAVSMTELSVVGIYVNYWLPDFPQWLAAFLVLAGVTAVNLIQVKLYGELEFWFALIKVAAVLGMIGLGVALIVLNADRGPGGADAPGFSRTAYGACCSPWCWSCFPSAARNSSRSPPGRPTIRRKVCPKPFVWCCAAFCCSTSARWRS